MSKSLKTHSCKKKKKPSRATFNSILVYKVGTNKVVNLEEALLLDLGDRL